MNMRTFSGAAVLALAALSTTACLEKETTHTLYLSPDGAVTWTAMERDVRSTEADRAARDAEEQAYLAGALSGTNDLAAALAALEPGRVQTRVLRRERPFTVFTEARFARIEDLGTVMLGALRVPGSVWLENGPEVTTMHIHLDLRGMDMDEASDSPVWALFEDELASCRIVLTDGQFVAAEGFALGDGNTTAEPVPVSGDSPKEIIDLSLSWRR
jgi:hypothetical protein